MVKESIKCTNFPKSDHMSNLRYVIGDAMEELYGKYNSTDEDKFGKTVGVGKGVISKIIHDGEIIEEDFTSVCCYLNPPKELKTIWKNFYVKNEDICMDKKSLSLNEVLSSDNNDKEFMCLPNQNIVKNINGTLYYAKITGFVGNSRVGNTILLERTYKNDKWVVAPASSFWINAEYELIKNG